LVSVVHPINAAISSARPSATPTTTPGYLAQRISRGNSSRHADDPLSAHARSVDATAP